MKKTSSRLLAYTGCAASLLTIAIFLTSQGDSNDRINPYPSRASEEPSSEKLLSPLLPPSDPTLLAGVVEHQDSPSVTTESPYAPDIAESLEAAAPPNYPQQWSISGLVVDQNDIPIPDIPISVIKADQKHVHPTAAHADSSGSFRIDGLEAGLWRVIANYDGLAPQLSPICSLQYRPEQKLVALSGRKPAAESVRLQLFRIPENSQRGAYLAGSVVDQEGAPVPGAALEAVSTADPTESTHTNANQDGFFAIGPFSGSHSYQVTAHGGRTPRTDWSYYSTDSKIMKPGDHASLVLSRASSFSVQVTHQALPVEGVSVGLIQKEGSLTLLTGEDGKVEFIALPPGEVSIVAYKDPNLLAISDALLIAEEAENRALHLELGKAASLEINAPEKAVVIVKSTTGPFRRTVNCAEGATHAAVPKGALLITKANKPMDSAIQILVDTVGVYHVDLPVD